MTTAEYNNIYSKRNPTILLTLLDLFGVPEVCSCIIRNLSRRSILCLTLVYSGFYRLLHQQIYSYIKIGNLETLHKLVRTVRSPVNIGALGGSTPKDIKRLILSIGEDTDGPKAISLSAGLQVIICHCPNVAISLRVMDKFCHEQPIIAFDEEFFPRVDFLLLCSPNKQKFSREYITNCVENIFASSASATSAPLPYPGPGLPASSFQVIPSRRGTVQDPELGVLCRPTVPFWRGLLGGHSFPDLEFLRIDHEPVSETDILCRGPQLQGSIQIRPADVEGVKRLVWFDVSYCPEFNDSILSATLPWMAMNLTGLRLDSNPWLTYGGISRLLHRNLPNLRFFQLTASASNASAEHSQRQFLRSRRSHAHPHLCPLLRRFCQNIKQVHISIPYICRDVLLSERRSKLMDTVLRKRQGKGEEEEEEASYAIERHFDELAPGRCKRSLEPTGNGYARAYIAAHMCRPEDHAVWAVLVAANYNNIMWIFGLEEKLSCITVNPQMEATSYPWSAVDTLIREYMHKPNLPCKKFRS